MTQLVTITAQRQITLPVNLFRSNFFRPGEKVLVSMENKELKITPALSLIRSLAGSVKIPKKYRNMPLDKIKKQAILDYFK